MDERQNDIINALIIIKSVCVSTEKCDYCPFYLNGCMIEYSSPDKWKINTEDAIWRAFK